MNRMCLICALLGLCTTLILADEPERLAQMVLHLLADEAARKRLGAAARRFAQQYDWRVVVPRFEQLYDQTLLAE